MAKEKKVKKVKKNVKRTVKNNKESRLPIRLQLALGFFVPVLFIIVVGVVSYNVASKNLEDNYTVSSGNAKNALNSSINVKQTTNGIIQNIHIFPVQEEELLTTKNLGETPGATFFNGDKSFIEGVKKSEDKFLLENVQIKCVQELETEANNLRDNMNRLENAVSEFKLSKEEKLQDVVME